MYRRASMLEHRRHMHNRCENRRRTAIHQGLCQLRQLLDESEDRGGVRAVTTSFPEEIPKRSSISRPETLSRAVARIEQLKVNVDRLERQHRRLVLEAQYLRRLSMGENVNGMPRGIQGLGDVSEVYHPQGGRYVGPDGRNFAHGTWFHADGQPPSRSAIFDGSLPIQSLIPNPTWPPQRRPRSRLSVELRQVTGHHSCPLTKDPDGTNGSDHQFIR